MALQGSGQISLANIAGEFGGAAPHSMSEYYRGGAYVTGNNTSVPTSGQITVSNFYGGLKLAVTWNTASGSLGSVYDLGRSVTTFTVSASANSGGVSYSIVSGAGASINSSTGVISSFASVGTDTTTTYTVRATSTTSATIYADRNFSVTRYAPKVSYYNYTGGDQTFTVPTGVVRVQFKLWGGGGGGNNNSAGGGAGYATGIRNTSSGQSYTLRVAGKGTDTCSGQCGASAPAGGYGGGGTSYQSGSGGGGSYVFYGGTAHGNCIAAAGGGGGEGASTAYAAGVGGGTSGTAGSGGSGGGRGGTQTAGGVKYLCDYNGNNGGALYGGNAGGCCGAGGGGGYYGGGSGCRQGGWVHKAGGGGSGYTGGLNSSTSMTSGSGLSAGNSGDGDNGGSYGGQDQHGRIVVRY